LERLLAIKNGFYAFKSALQVFPNGQGQQGSLDLVSWNSPRLWRDSYRGLSDGCVFFAQDVFGGQFCMYEDAICTFDPETGDRDHIAETIEEWASQILSNYEFLTGYPLAREWQQRHGALQSGKRLIPKQPFVLQGEYSVDNLYPLDAVRAMQLRASLARQIRELPDGAQIQFEVVE
jgi:hypothetical protein